jgi:Txe/YoeB family toxin of Txe-Axe toxin-antitoxin module
MDFGTILQLAGTVGGIASPALLISFRSSAQKYTDKKAENLATIQDTGKITDQVERIKSDYQMWFQASRFVYENEYTLLKEVWKESWELQAKARSLTPVVRSYFLRRGGAEERTRSALRCIC